MTREQADVVEVRAIMACSGGAWALVAIIFIALASPTAPSSVSSVQHVLLKDDMRLEVIAMLHLPESCRSRWWKFDANSHIVHVY